jgi:diaminohydroxyphosphoribosylaminopyrimidine deaminase/5-amino-6-(5-phosphoribosylamino)uracil reductase
MSAERDAFFMRKALALAERGRGRTSPNPMVGALVVDAEGVIVGRGAHEFAGGAHAEAHALADAGDRATGSTLFCTLEPCSHVGRTGACAPLVAAAGIRRVVIAAEDPNPVARGGSGILRERGLEVASGILADQARRLNAPFFTWIQRQRPFITLKVALSLDGMVSEGPDVRTSLTGAPANRYVHRERAEVDAVAVGSGTVLADDPLLTARVAYRERPLTRVVYDARLRTPPAARLFATLAEGPVIIMTNPLALAAAPDRAAALEAAGATIQTIDSRRALETSVASLGTRGTLSMVVEGGPALHKAFWDADLVDRVQILVVPRTIGSAGLPWLGEAVMGSQRIVWEERRPLGDDVLMEGYVHWTD